MEKFQEVSEVTENSFKTRSRLQLCQAQRLDKEKWWTSKNFGFRLSDF